MLPFVTQRRRPYAFPPMSSSCPGEPRPSDLKVAREIGKVLGRGDRELAEAIARLPDVAERDIVALSEARGDQRADYLEIRGLELEDNVSVFDLRLDSVFEKTLCRVGGNSPELKDAGPRRGRFYWPPISLSGASTPAGWITRSR